MRDRNYNLEKRKRDSVAPVNKIIIFWSFNENEKKIKNKFKKLFFTKLLENMLEFNYRLLLYIKKKMRKIISMQKSCNKILYYHLQVK